MAISDDRHNRCNECDDETTVDRPLTAEEEFAFPGPSSVNRAVLIDGMWYYADYNPLDGAMPIQDVGGNYIPVTTDPYELVLSIRYGFHAADLFTDETIDYDEQASAELYADLLYEHLAELYPRADITVLYDTDATGVLPADLRVAVNEWHDHPEILFIEDLAGKLYLEFAWLVPVEDG